MLVEVGGMVLLQLVLVLQLQQVLVDQLLFPFFFLGLVLVMLL